MSAVVFRSLSMLLRPLVLALSVLLGAAAPAAALSITVLVDTTPIAGVSGYVAFDFVDGDLAVTNTATIDNFGSDGLVYPISTSGDASGDLFTTPLVLGDTSFFNEGLLPIVYGTGFSFTLDLTENGSGLPAPDSFSLFLFDSGFNALGTTDPTGANALVVIDLVPGAVTPTVFLSSGAAALLVPEPALAALLGLAGAGVAFRRRRAA